MKKTSLAWGLVALCFLMFSPRLFAQDIIKSINKGNAAEVKQFLEQGVSPNLNWRETEYILSLSLENKSMDVVKLLASANGIQINKWNILKQPELSWKYTYLMKAIPKFDQVKLLVEHGANIDLQDDQLDWQGKSHESGGRTPLMMAIGQEKFSYPEVAKYLLDKGANVNLESRGGYTALIVGVHNAEIIKILIGKGAAIDHRTKGGETALMYAALKYPESVKLLIDNGANILIRQSTFKVSPNALDYAAKNGNIEAGKLLLAKAESIGKKSEVISSSLHWAVIAGQVDMAKYLLDEGAIVEGTDDGKTTPLMETSKLEMVQLLVKRGANVNAQNGYAYTPINKAISNFLPPDSKEGDCIKILNLLLDKGATVDTQDGSGKTPLMQAVQKVASLKIILEKASNINAQNKNGETALMLAVRGGFLKTFLFMPVVGPFKDAAKLLINKGADLNLQDVNGKTALMHAAGAVDAVGDDYNLYKEMVELLLEKGASIDQADKEGNTALYWAQRYNRTKICELLVSKGAKPAKKYDKLADKTNVKLGLVGTWEKYFTQEGVTYTTQVILGADYTYSKAINVPKSAPIPDGNGFNRYELRDGRLYLFNNSSTNGVVEYRFEGKDLVMNGEKYVKAGGKAAGKPTAKTAGKAKGKAKK